ncbi:hypothetical protein AAC387_Pa05g1967 [Persea americana]
MRRSPVSFSDLPISISVPIILHPTHLLQTPSSSQQTTTTIILSELPSRTHLTRPTSLSRPFPSFSSSHARASTPNGAHLPAAAARPPIAACLPQQPHATPSPAPGVELSIGRTHGKMECWEPIARTLQNLIVTRVLEV